jgi:hypothetical protein
MGMVIGEVDREGAGNLDEAECGGLPSAGEGGRDRFWETG